MKINAPFVQVQVAGLDLFFVKGNDGSVHQVFDTDIAHLGANPVSQVLEAIVTDYPNGVLEVPDECVRIKGGE